MAVTLWWGFLRENAPMGARGIRVQADFTAMPDGPAPDHFDGGQPASVLASPDDPGDQLRIQHGRLTYQPTTRGTATAYFSSPDLGSPVKSMGARFVFRSGSGTGGAIGLAVSRGIGKRAPPVVGAVPIYFVVTPINWNISVSRTENAPLEVVAADSFPRPLRQDGNTVYEARLTIDGAQVTVDLPGIHKHVSDPRFSEWQGSYATFDLFSNHGATDPIGAFEKIWAAGNRD
ncbi:hypothetical protein [Candidatus Mycobacterium methanotrophicum]|uniref:Uncharacterized protein n=1 Tax=Candidatus Mycobacterium methanotrophicum TaxID=2943498 RepID=A0ABY4QRH6_9MYCO|nr:hypothetical protein [Candidatus Mycobacterium methanotrophicum]UQX12190.1 hypothetical protein M5I08_07825 [Candidatus Mycobacterium methanotrophicum]